MTVKKSIKVYVTEEEKELIRLQAEKFDLSISKYLSSLALKSPK